MAAYIKQLLGTHGTAFEFIVPEEITQTAVGYEYPADSYSIVKANSVSRPVPLRVSGPCLHYIPE